MGEGCGAFDGFLPILGKTSALGDPCESALDHPAAGQDHEALCGIGPFDDVDCPAAMALHGVLQFVARIATIGEDITQPGTAADCLEQVGSTVAILNVGPVADRAAAITTLITTAKLNDVDPQAWLADVLARIAAIPNNRLPELLPWNWQPRDAQSRQAA
jgi:hypothetical protein